MKHTDTRHLIFKNGFFFEISTQPVTLGRQAQRRQSTSTQSIVHIFFAAGALAMFLGGSYLGTHLWMILHGVIAPYEHYVLIRRLHIYIQFYLFFGVFILGFLFQAAPRYFRTNLRPRKTVFVLPVCLLFGAAAQAIFPASFVGHFLLAGTFTLAIIAMAELIIEVESDLQERFGAWIFLSLGGFLISTFQSIESASWAIVAFWISIVPVVLGIGQQFLGAFVTNSRPNHRSHRVLLLVFLFSIALFLYASLQATRLIWNVSGVAALLLLLYYTFVTQMCPIHRRPKSSTRSFNLLSNPMALAFFSAYFWALLGAALLAIRGLSAADLTLHMWAIGWASTLILAVSSQVMRSIGKDYILSERSVWIIIGIWQIVPFGRTFSAFISLPPYFTFVVAASATGTISFWTLAIIRTSWQIFRN